MCRSRGILSLIILMPPRPSPPPPPLPHTTMAGLYRAVQKEDLFKLKVKHLEKSIKVVKEFSEKVRMHAYITG